MDQDFDAAFWDRAYSHQTPAWDDEPNPILVREAADLAPGTALDVGCGEGADARWLAQRGWRVTALDISAIALDRARAADAAHQVAWRQADYLAWQPPVAAYDLVTAHFPHVPTSERAAFFARLALAVRPKGTLLVVAHHPSDLEMPSGRPALPALYFTAEEVALLTPGRWRLDFSGTEPREVALPDGRVLTFHDTVLKAVRLDGEAAR